jgi:hypothetical protein
LGWVKLGEVRLGWVGLSKFKLGWVGLAWFRFGYNARKNFDQLPGDARRCFANVELRGVPMLVFASFGVFYQHRGDRRREARRPFASVVSYDIPIRAFAVLGTLCGRMGQQASRRLYPVKRETEKILSILLKVEMEEGLFSCYVWTLQKFQCMFVIRRWTEAVKGQFYLLCVQNYTLFDLHHIFISTL